jgi:DNA-binding FadR family transcriptional regulator
MSQNIIEIVRGKGTFVAQNTGVSRDPLGLDFLADPDLPLSLIEEGLRYAPRAAEDHRQAFREHSAILDAIREKNPEMAFQAMRQHLEASYRRTIGIGRRR